MLLGQLLELWSFLRLTYSQQGKPFEADHELLLQLYSLMAPVADLITSAQGGKHQGIPSVILIRAPVLNSDEPLEIMGSCQNGFWYFTCNKPLLAWIQGKMEKWTWHG